MTWIGVGGPGTLSDATGHRKRRYKRAIARLRRWEKRTRTRWSRAVGKRSLAQERSEGED